MPGKGRDPHNPFARTWQARIILAMHPWLNTPELACILSLLLVSKVKHACEPALVPATTMPS